MKILREIPETYEAVKFTGDNHEEIQKFLARHGAPVEWQKDEDGNVTHALIQTVQGTERVGRGAYVLANSVDQVSRAHRDEVEREETRKYVEVAEEVIDLRPFTVDDGVWHNGQYLGPATIETLELLPANATITCDLCKEEREPDEVQEAFNKTVCKYCLA